MGVVFRAVHQHLDRQAAVKVLARELAKDPGSLSRFFDEARAASVIAHPGIVAVLDCGLVGEALPFIVMELLQGRSLAEHLDTQPPLTIAEAAHLGQSVANALAAAHAVGIIHRDLKPDNIFLVDDNDRTVKVLDFGIAKLLARPVDPGDPTRTANGVLMGTPRYMSPEQCRGSGDVDHRSDIYALGCVLFEALTGRPPFMHEGYALTVTAHLTEPAPRVALECPGVPAGFDHLIDTMLAKSPGQRPQSMAEVSRVLSAYGSAAWPHEAPVLPARRRFVALWALLLASAGVIAAWAALRFEPVNVVGAKPTAVLEKELATQPLLDAAPEAGVEATAVSSATLDYVEVDSVPPGALVCNPFNGMFLGLTPLRLKRSAGEALKVVVHKAGYQPAPRSASPSVANVLVKLTPLGSDDLEEVVCRRPRKNSKASLNNSPLGGIAP